MPDPSSHPLVRAVREATVADHVGHVTRVMPTFVEADGPGIPLGSLCTVGADRSDPLLAEVVKLEVGRVVLAPFGRADRVRMGDRVVAAPIGATVPVGRGYLGRVIDALGRPVDGHGPLREVTERWPLMGVPAAALDKVTPDRILETGVRAIDTLLTLGIGQRIGIFAGSGVGKSTLLSQLAARIDADACVLCLVGERGREADAFWHHALDATTRARATMVVATSEAPAILRARAVLFATAVAEYLRAQGRHVLLLIDSMTRYALALRELGLAAGEPPALRGFTPSVFAALPGIVERCGRWREGGAITAIMTVLTESDDIDDPMAETLRALLDGHLVLSRTLAEDGHYPAIEVTRSISRVFSEVVPPDEAALAQRALAQWALHQRSRLLVDSGLYAAGSNPELDRALQTLPRLTAFLRQGREPVARAQALRQLADLVGAVP